MALKIKWLHSKFLCHLWRNFIEILKADLQYVFLSLDIPNNWFDGSLGHKLSIIVWSVSDFQRSYSLCVTFIMAERLLFFTSHAVLAGKRSYQPCMVSHLTVQYFVLAISGDRSWIGTNFTLWTRLKRAKLSSWWLSSKGNLHTVLKSGRILGLRLKKEYFLRKLRCQL